MQTCARDLASVSTVRKLMLDTSMKKSNGFVNSGIGYPMFAKYGSASSLVPKYTV